jgi:hypothetical protein
MQLNMNLLVKLGLCLQAIGPVLAADTPGTQLDRNDPIYRASLVKECGDLGVLDVPEGQLESETRHCANHPGHNTSPILGRRTRRGRTTVTDSAGAEVFALAARECAYTDGPKCAKNGYCWKNCGTSGNWCWMTYKTSSGPWLACDADRDCNVSAGTCSGGSCEECGCGGC